jgi:hypothetical protein
MRAFCVEATTGIEPVYAVLQSPSAGPLGGIRSIEPQNCMSRHQIPQGSKGSTRGQAALVRLVPSDREAEK